MPFVAGVVVPSWLYACGEVEFGPAVSGLSGPMVRVLLPQHLQTLARSGSEIELDVNGVVTLGAVLDALEARYPTLGGTIRDHDTLKRRPFVRFFACEEDWSHEPPEARLPENVASGAEPFLIVGALAGG
jgi:sulfur-carrier protein